MTLKSIWPESLVDSILDWSICTMFKKPIPGNRHVQNQIQLNRIVECIDTKLLFCWLIIIIFEFRLSHMERNKLANYYRFRISNAQKCIFYRWLFDLIGLDWIRLAASWRLFQLFHFGLMISLIYALWFPLINFINRQISWICGHFKSHK